MKILLWLLLCPALSYAGPYYEVKNSTSVGVSTMSISGHICVAASTSTYQDCQLRLDGPGGFIQFPDGTTQGSAGVVDSTAVIDGLPIGSIIQYSTTTAPDGYLYCDGSYVSTTTYSQLFAVTGHRYSTFTVAGSPAVFQLPDFRGMFARGADPTAVRDTDFRVVGSTQTDTMQGHRHSGSETSVYYRSSPYQAALVPSSGGASSATGGPITDGTNGTPRTGLETRPENIAVAFMIKYGHVGTVAISSSSLLIGGANTFTGDNTFTGSVTAATGVFTSSVTAAAFHGPLTGAASLNVLKAGDTMTGQLTTISSMTAQHLMLNQTPNPSLTFRGNNENNGGLIQYLQSDGDLAWKLWHNPSLADDLYLYSYLDGLRAVQAWKQNGNVGVGTVSPTHKFHVSGGLLATSSITANAGFYGDGSGLTGVIHSTATGYYGLRVATATYLATAPGACAAGQYISALAADGTKTCATPAGGGDVVLAATQTFTGANTFTGSVTASSMTLTGYVAGIHRSSSVLLGEYSTAGTVNGPCVTGSTITVTTVAPSRLRISYAGAYRASIASHPRLGVILNGQFILGQSPTRWIFLGVVANSAYYTNASFSVLSSVVPAGAYSACLNLSTDAGTATLESTYAVSQFSIETVQ